MAKRKDILNAALKALLAGAEASAWVKIPATFIAEIASLPKDKQDALDKAPADKFAELLAQAELSTTNAALAAVGTEQIKVLVSNLARLSAEQSNVLTKLTQNQYEETVNRLIAIHKNTEEIKTGIEKNHRQTQRKLDEIIGRLDPGITKDTKLAIEKIFLNILHKKDIPQWQWPEKLQEITKRHLELLEKWQTIQSGDPAVDKLRDQAHQMIERGDYDKADQFLQEAVAIDRKAIQSQQEKIDNRKLSMSQSLASRADLAKTKLDYKKAIDLYKDAIDSLPHNEQTLRAAYMNNLALLYYTVANYKEAEPLMKRALAIDEASFGKDHPKVATDLNNLAQLYQDTNRLSEAEPLMKRGLEIEEKSKGKNHPHVAIQLNNLAQLYQDTNRLAEAEPLMKRALAIDEANFGKDHPKMATDLNNLATLYQDTNRLAEAEPLMKRVLEIFEKSLGKNHPNVATALNNLAQLYKATNRLAEAEPLIKRALAIDETNFGKDHPKVAIRLNNLATLYQATNRLAEAEPLYKRALAIDEASFGKDHPKVAIRLNNLAQLYQATNRLAKAEPLMKRALAIDEASLGKDHPKVATDLNNLAELYKATNRLAEAEGLMERVVEILLQFTHRTGHPHPHLEAAFNNYTSLLVQMGHSKDEVIKRLKRLAPERFTP